MCLTGSGIISIHEEQLQIFEPGRKQNESIWNRVVSTLIVNRGDWLWGPANIKGANKDAKIHVGRSTTMHNLLFCAHTLCMNYVTNTFLLVSSSVGSKQILCFVQGQAQKTEQKHTTKNFVEFHNHSLLLTMAPFSTQFRVKESFKLLFVS